MMKRIVFASPKGGAGKTTLCRNLAVSAAAAGLKVAVGDLDPQRTLTRWWRRRGSAEHSVSHYELAMDDVASLVSDGSVDDCDAFFVDTPPSIETYPDALRQLIDSADFIVVPARPSLDDAESAVPFMAMLRRRGRRASFVLNAVKPRTNIIAVKTLLLKAGELCPVEVADRVDFMRAAEYGVGMADLGEHPGAREIEGVWNYVRAKVWGFVDVAA
ncbi:AAA family ATPase [Muricoccus radiodurans]|uniref:nucleotide-binding protein n=1 Tax=Muricoccus radiodurans TaxID=2231721 RepID=UPI003CEC10D5